MAKNCSKRFLDDIRNTDNAIRSSIETEVRSKYEDIIRQQQQLLDEYSKENGGGVDVYREVKDTGKKFQRLRSANYFQLKEMDRRHNELAKKFNELKKNRLVKIVTWFDNRVFVPFYSIFNKVFLKDFLSVLFLSRWDILIIIYDYNSKRGGDSVPIRRWLEHQGKKGSSKKLRIKVLDGSTSLNSRFERFVYKSASDKVLINGLHAFSFAKTYKIIGDDNSKYFAYMHETSWVLERFKNNNHYSKFKSAIKKCHVLCVSSDQESYYREQFFVEKSSVIYNTTKVNSDLVAVCKNKSNALKGRKLVVSMIGTVQERKGVELFSKVADLAASKNINIAFKWIGDFGYHPTNSLSNMLYLSPNVIWLGAKSGKSFDNEIRDTDILFLSSFDDPFPLSVLEALMLYKRVVVYKKVGTSEILSDIKGCKVFDDYTAECALDNILEAIEESIVSSEYDFFSRFASVEAFSERISASMGVKNNARGQSKLSRKFIKLILSPKKFFSDALHNMRQLT